MANYDGRSGSSQKIQPGWGMDQWGVRMQKAEQERMAKIAMKLAMSSAGGAGGEFDNPSGFEEGDLQFGTGEGEGIDLEDFGGGGPLDDLDYLEPDPEGAFPEASISSSGMEKDGFFGDPEDIPQAEAGEYEYDSFPGEEESVERAMEFGTDDLRVNEEKAAQADYIKTQLQGERLGRGPVGEYEMAQAAAQFDPLRQTGQYAGTGQAPMPPSPEQMAMMRFDQEQRERRRMGGMPGSQGRGY